MSRIGRKPIAIPAGVEVKVDGQTVTVKGPKGTLTKSFHPNMEIKVEGAEIKVERPNDEQLNRSLHSARAILRGSTLSASVTGFRSRARSS